MSLQGVDLTKGWVPIAVVITIAGMAAAGAWWASGMSSKVNTIAESTQEIKNSLRVMSELAEQVGKNSGRVDTLQDMVSNQNQELAMMATWIQTTRISLAEQGFKTPDYSYPNKGE